ncbi:integrase catalytic domain-containing protein [Trichonephila clavipes]|nr:integrase catalytic domain-containing protein [Trichonephila clavipes]
MTIQIFPRIIPRALYDNLEQQIRALATLGVTTDKCACLLYPLVESCIPEDLLRVFQRVMCTESNKNVNKPTSNKLEKEVKEQDKSLNLASILNTPPVLLQTLKVKIQGKNCSLIVRAMCDSGSQKSYIRKEMVSALRLAPLGQKHLPHALFGGARIKEKFHIVYKIELGSFDGSFNCNFDVVDQDIICNDVPPVSYRPWFEEL